MRREDMFVECAAYMYLICVTTCDDTIEENPYCPDCVDAVLNTALNAETLTAQGLLHHQVLLAMGFQDPIQQLHKSRRRRKL